jgi:hypothetical protein
MPAIAEREKRVGLNLAVDVSGLDVAGSPFAESTRSLNVSGGGLCFESQHKLTVGSRVTVHIALPPPLRKHFGSRTTYRARAVVCRVERYEGETSARIGAKFLAEVEA